MSHSPPGRCLAHLAFLALVATAAAQSPFGTVVHESTLGVPDVFHLGPPDDHWMGLGTEQVTLDFFAGGNEIFDGMGPDLSVYEVDQGAIEFGSIDVLVSLDGVAYVSVKSTEGPLVRIPGDDIAHMDDSYGRSYDVGVAGLPAIRFVRIQGNGGGAPLDNTCVDFDLDAVGAINTRPITVGGTAPADLRIEHIQVLSGEVEAGEQDVSVLVRVRNVGFSAASSLSGSLSFTGMTDRTMEYLVTPFVANPTACEPGEIVDLRFEVDVSPAASLETITVDAALSAQDAFSSGQILTPGAVTPAQWDVVAVSSGLQPVRFPGLATVASGYPGFAWESAPDDFFQGVGGASVVYDLLASHTTIPNFPGVDFSVYEVDHGVVEFAGIDVLVSEDGASFFSVKASETFLTHVPGDGAHGNDLYGCSYDLDAAGIPRANYIRIDGLGAGAAECSNGFDLDAIGLISADAVIALRPAELRIAEVRALPDVVAGGDTARLVEVTVENVGLARVESLAITLSFTGSADRTAEYTVTPFAGNPDLLELGQSATLAFAVDVDLLATTEQVTIDASVDAIDDYTFAPYALVGAVTTDTWQVDLAPCTSSTCGDCDQNGMTNILDALLGAQIGAGLAASPLPGSIQFNDCNTSGADFPDLLADIGVLDALSIAQFAAGVGTLVCCQ